MTIHYKKGWDSFQPDPGQWPDQVPCRVCGEILEVHRNVVGPRSSVEAMAGHESLHDNYFCKNSGEDWHKQALAILELAEKTPSKVMNKTLTDEAISIVATKKATK